MDYRRLGTLEVSVVGLGASKFGWPLEEASVRAIVDRALDDGVNFFDTADVYGGGESERLLGRALGGRRDRALIATKFGMDWNAPGGIRRAPGSAAAIRAAVEGSLARLGTDRIDLLQYHLPDGVTPIEETLGAMTELVHEGKVREIGCCNFDARQLEQAASSASAHRYDAFASAQNEYNLLARGLELELAPACQRLGVGVIPYFPLASGLLTGKYRRGDPGPPGAPPGRPGGPDDHATHDRLDALKRFAAERGLTPGQAAIGFLIAQACVATVIAGATSPEQVRDNAAAARWRPGDEDLKLLRGYFPRPGEPGVPLPGPASPSGLRTARGIRDRLRTWFRRSADA